MSSATAIPDAVGQLVPAVQVEEVSKTYRARRKTVRALLPTSFSINSGEFVALVGPSGCGKSTLLMMIAGLRGQTSGKILVDGKPVESPLTDIGIVFQRDLLMEWHRILDNILMQAVFRGIPKEKLRPRARELLEMVGLKNVEDRYPHELSGGMRQRVAICRALVNDPPLLLMDEPFGALDALTREQMTLDIQDIWSGTGKTVLFVTHSISEAVFLADRVLVFGPNPGRVVEDIRIDLPRPRNLSMRGEREFSDYTRKIRTRFEEMGVINTRQTEHAVKRDEK